jgi:DNA invertase Pin-like site-specific DNA recombinase
MDKKTTYLYCRLSKEDGDALESNSIGNQKKLLTDYAERNELIPYKIEVDDGYSGANFQRPGFQTMLAEVQAGNVCACVVKDLSRFGRSYLESGLYRELFHEKGVRFIAVNDNVDSAQGEDDFTPFREILNEFYVRDCSRKVKSTYRAKGLSGKPVGSHAIYGYKKSETDKNARLVDEEAAAVVRRIFQMTIEGYGPYSIATQLQAEKVECPSYYLARQGCGKQKNKDIPDPYLWYGTTIGVILAHIEYMGHTVNFKTIKKSFKTKRREMNSRDDWKIFENTHEPIVSRETWELANKLRAAAKRHKNSCGEPRPYTGLLFCATCGAKMYNERSSSPRPHHKDNFVCSNYRKKTEMCSSHRINEEAIEALILDTLRAVSSYAITNEDDFRKKVAAMFTAQADGNLKAQKKRLAYCERRSVDLDRLIKKLFEEHALGNLNGKRFDLLCSEYEKEQADIEAESATLRAGVDSAIDSAERIENFLKLTRRYRDFSELTVPMLNEFIERIIVHERDDKWCRHTEQQVDIYLNFIGNFAIPVQPDEEQRRRDELERKIQKREYHREYKRRRAANGGKPLKTEDTRTPAQIAADEAARKEKRKIKIREYQREYQRRLAQKRREAQAEAALPMAANQ